LRSSILFISSCNSFHPFGSHIRPYQLSKGLINHGWKIDHICEYLKDERPINIIPVQYLGKSGSLLGRPHLLLRYTLDLIKLTRLGELYDIVYVHSLKNQLPYLVSNIGKSNAKVIIDFHGLKLLEAHGFDLYLYSLIEKWLCKKSDAIILASELTKKTLIRVGVPSSKLFVVPNGVNVEKFYPLCIEGKKIRQQLGFENKFVVALIAPPSSSNPEALELTEKIASICLKQLENISFMIIGCKSIQKKIQNMVYVGFVSDLNLYLNAADIAIVPIPNHMRHGGALNKVLEYMACGLPVISTRRGIEHITEALNGVHYLYSQPSSKDFVEKIFLLKEDDKLRVYIGENARKLMVDSYSWQLRAKQLNDIFEYILVK